MDTFSLPNADVLSDADPAEATESVSSTPTTEDDYPPWEGVDATPSLSPEEAPSPDVAVAETESLEATDDSLDGEPAAETDAAPEPTDLERQLAAAQEELRLERERRESIEAKQREADAEAAQAEMAAEWKRFDDQQRAEEAEVIRRSRQMSDADAERYLAYHSQRLRKERDEKWTEVQHARDSQQSVVINHLAKQKFIEQVVTQYKLPQEAASYLDLYDPEVMTDQQLNAFIDHFQRTDRIRKQNQQLLREQAAQKRIASGADNIAGSRSGSNAPDSRANPKSPDYDPVYAYFGAGQWTRGRI